MFKIFRYAFNMASDAQIHVSRRVMCFSRVHELLRYVKKIMENTCPAFHVHHMLSSFALFDWLCVGMEWHLQSSVRGRRHGLTLNQRHTKIHSHWCANSIWLTDNFFCQIYLIFRILLSLIEINIYQEFESPREKTNNLHMRKQRRRSASL